MAEIIVMDISGRDCSDEVFWKGHGWNYNNHFIKLGRP